MLQTDGNWEYLHYGRCLGELFNQPTLRSYQYVQIPLNSILYHIDVASTDECPEGPHRSRFICDEIEDVLKFIGANDVGRVGVSLQTKILNNNEYVISSVTQIIEGRNASGQIKYFCKCSNNENYFDPSIDDTDTNLMEKRTVWPLSK